MKSDPDLRHSIALIDAFTAYQAGELTSDELHKVVGELREQKLTRLLARQENISPPCEKRLSVVPQVGR